MEKIHNFIQKFECEFEILHSNAVFESGTKPVLFQTVCLLWCESVTPHRHDRRTNLLKHLLCFPFFMSTV